MKNRIDKELVNRNLVPTRAKAQELIHLKKIKCNGRIITKCNFLISDEDKLEVLQNDTLKYVSRGGLKLEKAIQEFHLNFKDLYVMDIGSSTGGFCDCALKHGAKKIIAIDVGTDLLHETLKNDKRIELHEQTNFKTLDKSYFENIDMITVDVSFISLLKVIEKVSSLNMDMDMVCLIKPQFECGKEIATKYKGIILNKKIHYDIIMNLINQINKYGFYIRNITSSPIKGGDGNIEYISYITNKKDKNINLNIEKIINHAFHDN